MHDLEELDDDEARRQTLEELVNSMGAMSLKRLPKGTGGVSITVTTEGGEPDEDDLMGMDPRLTELIRKKKPGS